VTGSVPPSDRRSSPVWRVLQVVLSLALVVAIFVFALPRIANMSQVFATIGAMTWLELATLSTAAAWNFFTYWLVMIAVLPGLTLPQAIVANMTGAAIANSIPGGGALAVGMTSAMFRSWGFTASEIGLSILVSGVWNTFVKLGLPVVALAILAVQGQVGAGLVTSALIGVGILAGAVALFAAMLSSRELAFRIGSALSRIVSGLMRLVHRPPVRSWGDGAVTFRADTIELLRGRWVWLTVASLLSHLGLYLVLLLTLRHIGVSDDEVGWAAVLGAFAFMRLVSALPITPGGLGVVELGLTGALVLAGGDPEQVLAAVLVYRALTWLPTLPAGLATYVYWRTNRKWRSPVESAHGGVLVKDG
jgi:putative heme transporter